MAVKPIPFNTETVMKCQCTKCPVQADSACVKGKMSGMKAAMMKNPLQKEDVPGMYCSTGRATCGDTDFSKMCICMTCPIWEEYKLAEGKPMGYFCRDGASM
ncbi:hypothetical protein Dform_00365 [Dehalogenimonas formicexedens]|uniref:DUF2769 domain-containing protein n=1 Tax=Dehalogenimonas formicexedens TaxID=1839801 RepID=A0A1P8F5K8_9CHLR|nr:DUF2769 domain-containing protein [Dehalogenimonas formicexedens]APV43725.1 hypothetical protein Dform_00365 [Dehalogenimonas formicexedens]